MLVIIAGALLLACTPNAPSADDSPVSQSVESEAITPIDPGINKVFATPDQVKTTNQVVDESVTELEPTSKPFQFTFDGSIVLNIFTDFDASESGLYMVSNPFEDIELLLAEEEVSYGQVLLSPSGRSLAYTRQKDDSVGVWVLDLTTNERLQWGESVPLSFIDRNGYLEPRNGIIIQEWSPDEQTLIIQDWKRETPRDEPVWSYLLSLNEKVRLGSRILDLSWSPIDPASFFYISEDGEIYYGNGSEEDSFASFSENISLASGSIAWHPNGRDLAVVTSRLDESTSSLWIVDKLSGDRTFVETGAPGPQLIRWAPDGKHLFWFTGNSSSVLGFNEDNLDTDISKQTIPTPLDPGRQVWLPDSSFFGLFLPSPTINGGVDLCFYSIQGERVKCPLKSETVINQLQLGEGHPYINATWVPQANS